MRLIGSVKNQQEAFVFQKYCKAQKIDLLIEKAGKDNRFQVWVINEDQTDRVEEFLEKFNNDPSSPEFYVLPDPVIAPTEQDTEEVKVSPRSAKLPIFTWVWIAFSVLIFFFQMGQEVNLVKSGGIVMMEADMTPIEKSFLFDVPQGFEKLKEFVISNDIKNPSDFKNLSTADLEAWEKLKQTAYFHGFLDMLDDPAYKESYLTQKMPLFSKIREGQIYRLVTPVFLHGSILHILFNMIWIFILMKQIELKIGIVKTALIAVITGAISNIAQYLISGPFFLGASGIIVGLAGFIWMRQKKAPWEGYLLSKTIFFFLLIYVLSLAALSIGIFVFNLSSSKNLGFGIANTAHVVGGLAGLALGRLSFLRRT